MEEIKKIFFEYSWEVKAPTTDCVSLRGTLDRSTVGPFASKLKSLREELQSRVKNSKVIIINVSELDFWDTEGIAAIVGESLTPLVQQQGAKIGFYGNKFIPDQSGEKTQTYSDAVIKHGTILDTPALPWGKDYDETYRRLQLS